MERVIELAEKGIVISGSLTKLLPLSTPYIKVMLSNTPPPIKRKNYETIKQLMSEGCLKIKKYIV